METQVKQPEQLQRPLVARVAKVIGQVLTDHHDVPSHGHWFQRNGEETTEEQTETQDVA